jgi:hypothetical protein
MDDLYKVSEKSSIEDCAMRAEKILNAIIEIGTAQVEIDNVLKSDYRLLPDACVPEIFRDDLEPAAGVCKLTPDQVKPMFIKQREWAKLRLNQLAEDLSLKSEIPGDDNFLLSRVIQEEADALDITDETGLLGVSSFTDIISETALKMFMQFNDCMQSSFEYYSSEERDKYPLTVAGYAVMVDNQQMVYPGTLLAQHIDNPGKFPPLYARSQGNIEITDGLITIIKNP